MPSGCHYHGSITHRLTPPAATYAGDDPQEEQQSDESGSGPLLPLLSNFIADFFFHLSIDVITNEAKIIINTYLSPSHEVDSTLILYLN